MADITGVSNLTENSNGAVSLAGIQDAVENLDNDKLEAADIATKATKVSSPTTHNFAGLTSGGDLEDSGHKHSDYATAAKGVTNGDTHDHIGGDGNPITEGALSLSDVTTNDVSTSKHGFVPKAPNDANKVLDGTGAFVTRLPYKYTAAIDTDTTVAGVVSTDTNIGSLSIPAMGANDMLIVEVFIAAANSSSSNMILGMKAGSTLLKQNTYASNNGENFYMRLVLAMRNSTSAQYNTLETLGDVSGLKITGGATAVDLSSAWTLNIFVNQNSTNNQTIRYAIARKITSA